jgi:hypothetical protein
MQFIKVRLGDSEFGLSQFSPFPNLCLVIERRVFPKDNARQPLRVDFHLRS